MHQDLQEILITEEQIDRRVRELAACLNNEYKIKRFIASVYSKARACL